ncbi:MAG TPA: YkvA family protein [Longimicrobiales bacterium]|nr:YkvA family protein [Longimicrobiales bacterium]
MAWGGKHRRKALVAFLLLELPRFVGLLYRLLRHGRLSRADKALIAAVIAYVALPIDLIPDPIAAVGLVDDLFLVATALGHLLSRADGPRLARFWRGNPGTLRALVTGVDPVGGLLPRRVRRALQDFVHRR